MDNIEINSSFDSKSISEFITGVIKGRESDCSYRNHVLFKISQSQKKLPVPIEQRTNIDFLNNLPDEIEDALESVKATDAHWKLDTKLDTNFRPTTRKLCVLDRIKRSEYNYDQ